MFKKKNLLWITLLLLFILGCQKSPSKSILIYSSLEEKTLPPFIALWEAQHPDIKLKIIRDSSGVITSRYLAEKDNPQADIIWSLAISQLLPYIDTFAPVLEHNFSHFRPHFYDENPQPKWVGLTAFMNAININTIELEKRNLEIPTSYRDLLKPQYKDFTIMPNPLSSGSGYFSIWAWTQIMGEEEAWKYMSALDENISQYTHSGSAISRFVSQGEAFIGLGIAAEGLLREREGAPIRTIFPIEKSGWDIDVMAIVKKENISEEAKLFYYWALSPDVFKLYAQIRGILADTRFSSTIEGYPSSIDDQLIENNFSLMGSSKNSLLKKWEDLYGSE